MVGIFRIILVRAKADQLPIQQINRDVREGATPGKRITVADSIDKMMSLLSRRDDVAEHGAERASPMQDAGLTTDA